MSIDHLRLADESSIPFLALPLTPWIARARFSCEETGRASPMDAKKELGHLKNKNKNLLVSFNARNMGSVAKRFRFELSLAFLEGNSRFFSRRKYCLIISNGKYLNLLLVT
jgi:hypothetical protein